MGLIYIIYIYIYTLVHLYYNYIMMKCYSLLQCIEVVLVSRLCPTKVEISFCLDPAACGSPQLAPLRLAVHCQGGNMSKVPGLSDAHAHSEQLCSSASGKREGAMLKFRVTWGGSCWLIPHWFGKSQETGVRSQHSPWQTGREGGWVWMVGSIQSWGLQGELYKFLDL